MKHTRTLLLGLILIVILTGFRPFLSIVDKFKDLVNGYYHEKIGSTLFLHTDKSIYIPNESIWFKAYILESDPLQHEVLYLRLLDDQNKIVLQNQFMVYDIRSNGDMLIPITMAPGRYRLIAYTDKMISFDPENVFVQQIQIIKDQSFDIKTKASVSDKNKSKDQQIRLSKTTTTISAYCYPEGGHLVNGLSNRVLIALNDANGKPLAAKVTLTTSTKQVITTTTNMEGHSLITFVPDVKENYSLVIDNAGHLQTIAFPVKIDSEGYVIQLIGSADHPEIMVKNQNMSENTLLLGRSLSELKFSKNLSLKSGDSIRIPLSKNDSVNHIIDLGLFDTNNKLLAERLVYLPVPEKYRIKFQFDKARYLSREKVKASISLTDVNGNNIPANLSVAVVAKQMLDPLTEKRITETDLNTLQNYPTAIKDINELNNRLIKQHFKLGDWTAVMNYQPTGKIEVFSFASGVYGTVISKKKKKKNDLNALFFIGGSGITTVPLDASGNFYIPANDLVLQNGKANYLVVDKDFNDKYDLEIKDYSADFETKLLLTTLPKGFPVSDLTKPSDQLLSVLSGKVLSEVVIQGKKRTNDDPTGINVIDYHSPNCFDYICFNNILNCKNHPDGGMSPVEGQIYVLNGRPIRYYGCASNKPAKGNIHPIKNIDFPRAFYLPDYAKENISAPELQSTIFWEPNLTTPASGKATIEFYTSDIKGEFTIVVQGITVKGLVPVFGKTDFKVISK